MSTDQENTPDPSTILCRIVDVNNAIQNTFKRFLDSEGQSLDELATFLREELSKIELFAPSSTEDQQEQLQKNDG